MYKCERIGIPSFDRTLIYECDGREAKVCYNDRWCKLQLFINGKQIMNMEFPLSEWNEVREYGAHWILSGSKPTDKHAA